MHLHRLVLSRHALILLIFGVLLVNACSRSGPVRRISEPAVSIQQLTVGMDGNWSLELRLQNFSSVPMRFEGVALAMRIGEQEAGQLKSQPALTIGPESADVLTLTMQPSSDARIILADALARGREVAYRIEGTLEASPHDRDKVRSYDVRRHSTLNPMPGLPGVLR